SGSWSDRLAPGHEPERPGPAGGPNRNGGRILSTTGAVRHHGGLRSDGDPGPGVGQGSPSPSARAYSRELDQGRAPGHGGGAEMRGRDGSVAEGGPLSEPAAD